jgi:acyl-CoA synthetase (AMP-forming)/AMP-acid ligase II
MPLFHVAGVNPGLLTILHGACGAILRDIDMAKLLELLVRERVAYAFLAPVLINMLLVHAGDRNGGPVRAGEVLLRRVPDQRGRAAAGKARLKTAASPSCTG